MNLYKPKRTKLVRLALAVALSATIASACQTLPVAPPATTPTTSPAVPATPSFPAPLAGTTAGFVAFGDGGSAESVQQQVADQMANWINSGHRADALVEAGDDVYPDGDPSRFSAALDVPYSAIRRQDRPLWVALGNHDVQAGHGAEQLAYLGLPTMPYAKTITGAQILFLDANNPDAAQAAWLETQLSAPGPALRIVVFHQPAYSCATHGSTALVDSLWVPIIEAHHVALVINGHDHYYERFRSSSDVTYVVTGGGGYELYARKSSCAGTPPSQATASRHHFVGIEIAGSTLRLTAIARTGETLDQTTITR